MITSLKEPHCKEAVEALLHPYVREWFFSKFKEFSLPQLYGVKEVHEKNNILVIAGTGGTKCVTPDTSFLINYKGSVQIATGADLISLAQLQGRLLKRIDKTGKLYEIKDLMCFSLKGQNIIQQKALVYFEETDDILIKIKTQYGREIKLSKDHPLLVEKKDGLQWIASRDIKKGDKIAVARTIPLPENEIFFKYKRAIIRARSRARYLVDFPEFINLKNKTKQFMSFDSLSTKEFYELKSILSLSFEEMSRITSISVTSLFKHINKKAKIKEVKKFNLFLKKRLRNYAFEKNRVIITDRGGKFHSFLIPYAADQRLVSWLAFVLAEGLIGDYEKGTQLIVSQKNRMRLLHNFFKNTKELFDLTFQKKKGSDKDYTINSTTFCYFLCDLLDLKRGRGRYVPSPSWILNMKKELKSIFINVFLSLESTLSRGRSIVVSQANKNKIETLNYLLLSYGILPSLRKIKAKATNTLLKKERSYYQLTIYGIESLKIFFREIDIDHPLRDVLLEHTQKKITGNYVNKFVFDYKKIRKLSCLYQNDKQFNKELGNIYKVVLRTGYITMAALRDFQQILIKFNNAEVSSLHKEVEELIKRDFDFVKVVKKSTFRYKGKVVDLTVPNEQNFVGGFGGLILHNTLTSFLAILNELVVLATKQELKDKVYAVYISPLKALNADIAVNLERPLEEITSIAHRHGHNFHIRVGVRTGDTSPSERQKMLKHPPHILITTPESLALMLSSIKFKELLRDITWSILDEVHSLAENKRGVHLSLSLERLQDIAPLMARIGLSATVEPVEEIAKYLVGEGRLCKIAQVQLKKEFDLQVISPLPNLIDTTYDQLYHGLYTTIDKLIEEHKTTLIFTNTRAGTERVVHHLKTLYPSKYVENIEAHHGSLSKRHRFDVEKKLREGKLKAVVCSTSLELGIDIGYIDLVICLGSPKSVARLLQRTGRAGHRLHDTVKGRLLVLDRDDLVECSVLLKYALEKKIDRIHIPTNCLDVLAQQIYGMAVGDRWNIKDVYALIKKSYCYKDLSYHDFMEIIQYLAGHYGALEERHVYAKIWYDEENGEIAKRGSLGRLLYMTNVGTIPDQTGIIVKAGEHAIGTVDEGFLERLQKGDVFVLGGNTYQFQFARGMVAQVHEAPGKQPTVPSWYSEMLPLSFDLASGIQKFRRFMLDLFVNNQKKEDIFAYISNYLFVDANASNAIYSYFFEQYLYSGIPHDKSLHVEFFTDEMLNKKFAVFHTLWGRRVNDVLSRAVGFIIGKLQQHDVEIGISDNGFYLASEKPMQVLRALELLQKEDLEKVMKFAIDKTEVLKRRFRHCAGRALMILRQYKGERKTAGRQQVSSMILLHAVKRISENFCILKEARREVLEDLMDISHAREILERLKKKEIEIKQVHHNLPSPFAFNLVTQGHTDTLQMEDKMAFLRRMHRNVLAKIGKRYSVDLPK